MPVTQPNGRTGKGGDLTTKQWSAMLVKSVMDGCSSCTMYTDASAIVMDYATGIDFRPAGHAMICQQKPNRCTCHDACSSARPKRQGNVHELAGSHALAKKCKCRTLSKCYVCPSLQLNICIAHCPATKPDSNADWNICSICWLQMCHNVWERHKAITYVHLILRCTSITWTVLTLATRMPRCCWLGKANPLMPDCACITRWQVHSKVMCWRAGLHLFLLGSNEHAGHTDQLQLAPGHSLHTQPMLIGQ